MSESQQSRRRVTFTQLQTLWEFLNDHKEIAVGYNKSAQAREHSKKMWLRAATILNSGGEGAVKSGPEWSKYWVDLKAKIKRKNRLIRDATNRTGGGPPLNEELSEIERKFLVILGQDYGSGLPGVQVHPIVTEIRHDEQHSNLGNQLESPSFPSREGSETAIFLDVDFEENVQETVTIVEHSGAETNTGSVSHTIEEQLVSPLPSTSSASRAFTQRRLIPQSTERSGGPRRRRRLERRYWTAAEAREQLVVASKARSEAELANSRSVQQAVGILKEMLDVWKKIETKWPGEVSRDAQLDPDV